MEKNNNIILAKNLQRLMNEKGVDRYKLCEDLGFKYSTVCEWLSANKYPRMDKIEMLALYFNVKKSDIIEEPYDNKPTFPPQRRRLRGGKAVLIKKLAPDEVRDEAKQRKAVNEMSTEELLSLLDDVTKALQDKQHNQVD